MNSTQKVSTAVTSQNGNKVKIDSSGAFFCLVKNENGLYQSWRYNPRLERLSYTRETGKGTNYYLFVGVPFSILVSLMELPNEELKTFIMVKVKGVYEQVLND